MQCDQATQPAASCAPYTQVQWEDKISRAVFTGNMKTSPNRQTIFRQAQSAAGAELLFVNEVSPSVRQYVRQSAAIRQPGVLVWSSRTSFSSLLPYISVLRCTSHCAAPPH